MYLLYYVQAQKGAANVVKENKVIAVRVAPRVWRPLTAEGNTERVVSTYSKREPSRQTKHPTRDSCTNMNLMINEYHK